MQQEKNYNVHILLGVWGERFIDDFLQLSLPSLLAPGNIPAIAKKYQTTFVFLTYSFDIPVFENHPAYQKLRSICNIQFIEIDDLIVIGNYSTSLTFAYDRAIKQTGEQMLNTYFIFLTSDYIMADGSLEGLMRYMEKGYSGICTGNFQAIEEDVKKQLLDKVDQKTHELSIKPRKLLELSFPFLHPITTTSFLDQHATHNYHANRFFIQHDANTIAGCFYLLHMLCIKPETMNYKIGASCDYSFIPEMCPSGNIGIINDSDDYLVLEVQPKNHELNFIKWGPYNTKKLARGLAEWTTARHRKNSEHTIYYHIQDIDDNTKERIEKTFIQYIEPVQNHLNRNKPKPHYQHPYWLGAVFSFERQRKLLAGKKGVYVDISSESFGLLRKIYHLLVGVPPNMYRWHYRWFEHRQLKKALYKHLASGGEECVVLYTSYFSYFMHYRTWLEKALGIKRHYFMQQLTYMNKQQIDDNKEKLDKCICFTDINGLKAMKDKFSYIRKMIKDDGKLIIVIVNDKNYSPKHLYDFQKQVSFRACVIPRAIFNIAFVESLHSTFTFLGEFMRELIKQSSEHKRRKRLWYMSLVFPAILGTFISNLLPFGSRKGAHCTNVILTLEPKEESN